jgi:hypothetical protein
MPEIAITGQQGALLNTNLDRGKPEAYAIGSGLDEAVTRLAASGMAKQIDSSLTVTHSIYMAHATETTTLHEAEGVVPRR